MLSEQLVEMAGPVLRQVVEHPFWSGLRDGSLPGAALVHFVQQDTGHLLPAYGRGLSRCAAAAADEAHAAFFARAATGTLEATSRLREAFAGMAPSLGLPELAGTAPIAPPAQAYGDFFLASAAGSVPAGLGALLPMAWFNLNVSRDLAERGTPDSRYAKWIELYQPSDGYSRVVDRYLGIADEIGARSSAAECRSLVDHFAIGIRYEWLFAEGAWRQAAWPV